MNAASGCRAFRRRAKKVLVRVAGCVTFVLSGFHALAADAAPVEMVLWQNGAPGELPDATRGEEKIVNGIHLVTKVGVPTLLMHQPSSTQKKRRAIILCPGGGYKVLAAVPTGNGVLEPFLNDGYVVFVLKYRIVPNPKEAQASALLDAKRAVRLVRAHAEEWGVDPQEIGMAGWSAGANLILNLVSDTDSGNPLAEDSIERQSCRPDFVAMLCPWPREKRPDEYSISAVSPPAFIASARDDRTAPTPFASGIADEYRKAGVACKLWVIDQGGHRAFSFDSTGEGSHWRERFLDWLGSVERSD